MSKAQVIHKLGPPEAMVWQDWPARLIKFSRAFILCLKLLANRSAWCFD